MCFLYRDARPSASLSLGIFTHSTQIRRIITSALLNKAIFFFFRIDWKISYFLVPKDGIFAGFNNRVSKWAQIFNHDSLNRHRRQSQHFQQCFSQHLKMYWPLSIKPPHFISNVSSPAKTSNHKLLYNFLSLLLYCHQASLDKSLWNIQDKTDNLSFTMLIPPATESQESTGQNLVCLGVPIFMY